MNLDPERGNVLLLELSSQMALYKGRLQIFYFSRRSQAETQLNKALLSAQKIRVDNGREAVTNLPSATITNKHELEARWSLCLGHGRSRSSKCGWS